MECIEGPRHSNWFSILAAPSSRTRWTGGMQVSREPEASRCEASESGSTGDLRLILNFVALNITEGDSEGWVEKALVIGLKKSLVSCELGTKLQGKVGTFQNKSVCPHPIIVISTTKSPQSNKIYKFPLISYASVCSRVVVSSP